jgi:hypothetical protein
MSIVRFLLTTEPRVVKIKHRTMAPSQSVEPLTRNTLSVAPGMD